MPTTSSSTPPKSALAVIGIGLIAAAIWAWPQGDKAQTPEKSAAPELAPETDSSITTVTICALRDHSIEVAIELLKESDFEETHGIRVEAILLEFEPMVRAHELSFMGEDSRYDLVAIDQPSLGRYVTEGWVQPLDDLITDGSLPSLNVDDILPALRQACGEWDGSYYAVPLGSYGALFAYRTDALASAGLEPPATFTEFMDHARLLNAPQELYGTALFAHLGEYITADSAPFLWSWGAGLINGCDVDLPDLPAMRVAWDTDQGIAALEFYASFYEQKLTPPDTLNFDHARYISAFQDGKVAMGIMPAEGIGAPMEDPEASKVAGKIAYTTLPGRRQPDGSVAPSRPGLGAHSLAISSFSQQPREAYLVMQFLTGAKLGPEYMRRGGRPFRNSHFSPEALNLFPHLEAMRDGMESGRCRPNIPEYPAVSEIFFTAFHSALKHGAPVGDVMRAAAKVANEQVLAPAYPEGRERPKQPLR